MDRGRSILFSLGAALLVVLGALPQVLTYARINQTSVAIARALLPARAESPQIEQTMLLQADTVLPEPSGATLAVRCASERTRARVSIAFGDYGGAIATLEALLDTCPNDLLVRYWLGRAHEASSRWCEAILYFREAGASSPLEELGDALARQELWSDALQAYAAALDLRPDDCANHVRAGNAIWRAQANPVESVAHFSRAVELCPHELWAYVSAARVLTEAGEYAEAEGWAILGGQVAPTSEVPLNILGLSRLRQNRPGEAVPYLRDALELNPASAEAHALLGSAYINMGQFSDAVRELAEAVRTGPGKAWQYEALGVAYERMGDYSSAIAAYEMALGIDPTRQSARDKLGLLQDGR